MPARIPRLFFIILFSTQRIKKPPLCSITNPRSNGKVIGGFPLVFAVLATRQEAAQLGSILRVRNGVRSAVVKKRQLSVRQYRAQGTKLSFRSRTRLCATTTNSNQGGSFGSVRGSRIIFMTG